MQTALTRSDRTFLPPSRAPSPASNATIRAVATQVLAHLHRRQTELVVEEAGWSGDRALEAMLHHRAAISPATTTATGWAAELASGNANANFIASLGPAGSAASRLIAAGVQVNLTGLATIDLPWPTSMPTVAFVGEGQPIPVGQPVFGGGTVGPAKKMALILAYTNDLSERSLPDAALVITRTLQEAAARSLDSVLFDNQPGSALRPPGLLNGVTPISATTGGGLAAASADVGKLVGAIADAHGGLSVMLFANPREAVRLPMLSSGGLTLPVVPTLALAAGSIVAVESSAFASAFTGTPEIDVTTQSEVHMDTSPQQIGVSGSPTAPVRSLWQTDSLAARVRVNCAWAMRAPGLVQVINSVTW